MPVLLVVFALTLTACSSQESITAPVQSHPQAAKSGEAAGSEGSAETDRAVLVALYLATTGSSYLGWDNWLCEAPLDQWAGVTTDENGRVRGLDLNGDLQHDEDKLRGFIPPELAQLDNLQYLDLSDNELSGSIPPELGNLKNLQHLNLSDNDLRGFIPPELGNLKNLQYLGLSANDLRGFIPPELGDLENLQHLRLSFNGLCGPIPSELGNLGSLQDLSLYRNQLSGSIPPELGNLGSLQDLLLDRNQLSGEIPSELGNLDSLQSLSLSGNQLSGCIPSALLNFVSWLPVCGDEPEPVAEIPEPAAEATLAQVSEVFAVSCAISGCHSGGEPAAGLSLEGDFAALIVGVDSGQRPDFKLVDPGNPDKSYLLIKVRGDDEIVSQQMPPGAPLTAEQVEIIRAWIASGAKE